MEQLVDKPTRNEAILDLLYTDAPELFAECSVDILKPVTDHDLVSFPLRIPDGSTKVLEEVPPELPDIMKYNFKQADEALMAQELAAVDWDEKIGLVDNAIFRTIVFLYHLK